jgi:alpha-maltose-1-phosphate synthase
LAPEPEVPAVEPPARAILVNLSTSGSRLGGAAVAANWHARFLAPLFPVELWRMWDQDGTEHEHPLRVRNFRSYARPRRLTRFLPRQVRGLILDSDLGATLLATRPALVHIHNPLPALAFERIVGGASRIGAKVVVSTHGFFEVMRPHGLGRSKRWVWDRWVRDPILRSLKNVDAVLAGYPEQAELLETMGIDSARMHLVPNGVDPAFASLPTAEDLARVAARFQLDDGSPVLLFFGNHTMNKGIDTILQLAARLRQPATVVIGGRLSDPAEPQRWRSKFPPAPGVRVLFTDYLSLDDQRALYHLAALLLFPSRSDTLPLTILEAMACGPPVVAFGIGGIPFQLQDGAGVVVPPGDPRAFEREVESLLADEARREALSAAAKRRQQEHFTWRRAAEQTVPVYEALLGDSSRGP